MWPPLESPAMKVSPVLSDACTRLDDFAGVIVVFKSHDARVIVDPHRSRSARGVAREGAGDHDEACLVGLAMEIAGHAAVHHQQQRNRRAPGKIVGPVDVVIPVLPQGSAVGIGGVQRKVDAYIGCRKSYCRQA